MDTASMNDQNAIKRPKRTMIRVPYFLLGIITGTLLGIGLLVVVTQFVI